MSEIEIEVIKSYKKLLATNGVSKKVIEALVTELSEETPNAEKLAKIIRSKDVLIK